MSVTPIKALENVMVLAETVGAALEAGHAVVALESTIITHGMPWPANLETARLAEQSVREAGAVPATIALLNGSVHVGLSDEQLEQLARKDGAHRKCSLRDLAPAASSRASGGTTVAATLHLAHCAGIRVFATGGIGGVHRGAGTSMDVSADLPALAANPLAVVCAGPKAILDLGLTLEYLETLGVPVVGYQTDELPAFWSRESGFALETRAESPADIAAMLEAQRLLGLNAAHLVCNPVPRAHALPADALAAPIDAALKLAEEQHIKGRELTPFLLASVLEATGGESLQSNQALMAANARLAGAIACALPPR